MRDKTLAVDCPAREPDPVLLAQLTALAAASTAPVVKPWWQRFSVKTGAATVAGVLIVSGATADAEHAHHVPTVEATIVATPSHPVTHHKRVRISANQTSPAVSPPVLSSVRHAGKRAHRTRHAHTKKHQDGNSNGGGSENSQGDVQLARISAPQSPVGVQDSQNMQGQSHGRAHMHQQANSQH
ncbi:MAG: hypothetical protein ACTHJM_06820 [Marmoricola sp.]